MIVMQRQIAGWFESLYLLCQNSVKRAYNKLYHEVLFCLSNHEEILLIHLLMWGRERCSLVRDHDT